MSEDFERQEVDEYYRLSWGDPEWVERLRAGGLFALTTPFVYPGRGPVVVYASAESGRVRLSERGELLRYLESQGLDLSLDQVLSKTVFRAAQDTPGARLGGGQLYLDTQAERVPAEVSRFVQLVLEVVGLRHGKYKDALVKLSRREGFNLPKTSPPDF